MKKYLVAALTLSLIASSCAHGMLDKETRKEIQEMRVRTLLTRAFKSYKLNPKYVKAIFIKNRIRDYVYKKPILYIDLRLLDPQKPFLLEYTVYHFAASLSNNYCIDDIQTAFDVEASVFDHLLQDGRYDAIINLIRSAIENTVSTDMQLKELDKQLSNPTPDKESEQELLMELRILQEKSVDILTFLHNNRYEFELQSGETDLKSAAEIYIKNGKQIPLKPQTVMYLNKDKKRIACTLSSLSMEELRASPLSEVVEIIDSIKPLKMLPIDTIPAPVESLRSSTSSSSSSPSSITSSSMQTNTTETSEYSYPMLTPSQLLNWNFMSTPSTTSTVSYSSGTSLSSTMK